MGVFHYSYPGTLRVDRSHLKIEERGQRLCVTGGRNFTDRGFVWEILSETHLVTPIVELGAGCARGVDWFALMWAEDHNIPWRRYVADWDGLGRKKAGPARNGAMLKDFQPDKLLVFPGGNGTTNCARQARQLGIPRTFFESEDE